jgi:phosphoglycolate phosphatase
MHALFDLDGTLVDPGLGIIGSVQYALDRLGAPVPPTGDLAWVIGPPLRNSFAKLLGGPERAEEALSLYRQRYLGGAMYDATVYAGVPEMLGALSAAGCRLLVATAKPHAYARLVMRHVGLDRHFSGIYGPELDGRNDNKADLIAHIAASQRLRPDAAVMVGDRAFDVAAAASNGIRTVGATWGYGGAEELAAAGAVELCDSPRELAQIALALLRPTGPAPVQLSHRG